MGIPKEYQGKKSVAVFITPKGDYETTYWPNASDTRQMIEGKCRLGYKLAVVFDGVNIAFFRKAKEFTINHQPQPNTRIELSDILQTVH